MSLCAFAPSLEITCVCMHKRMYVFMNMYTHTHAHIHVLMTYVETGVYQRPTTEARIRGAHATPVLLLLLSRVSAASASDNLPRSFHLLLLRRICSHPLHFLRRSLLQPATLGRRVTVALAASALSQRANITCYKRPSKRGGGTTSRRRMPPGRRAPRRWRRRRRAPTFTFPHRHLRRAPI